ncbi:MAG: SDR family NAD(P)-dependent oxidoreductase [Lewinellaceae bacterium]|nr:SDR family NAD(P)-dependent oxidoreductase [Lewinellaceae bacterium]
MKLNNKVAIVTGSAMGIGKAIARHLGREGASVVLNGRDPVRLSRTCYQLLEEGLDVSACVGDISNIEDCRKLVAHAISQYGRLDILINNAGVSHKGFFKDTLPGVFRESVEINILGTMFLTREALPGILASKGQILFISSLAGLRGFPFHSLYCLTKMAQTALAESLRSELIDQGVHVGIIYVGITKNDPAKRVIFSDGTPMRLPERNHSFAASPERVAGAVLQALERKRFKSVVGWHGMFYSLFARFAPRVMDFAFRRNTDFIVKQNIEETALVHRELS